jgi:hypothetical protein
MGLCDYLSSTQYAREHHCLPALPLHACYVSHCLPAVYCLPAIPLPACYPTSCPCYPTSCLLSHCTPAIPLRSFYPPACHLSHCMPATVTTACLLLVHSSRQVQAKPGGFIPLKLKRRVTRDVQPCSTPSRLLIHIFQYFSICL